MKVSQGACFSRQAHEASFCNEHGSLEQGCGFKLPSALNVTPVFVWATDSVVPRAQSDRTNPSMVRDAYQYLLGNDERRPAAIENRGEAKGLGRLY